MSKLRADYPGILAWAVRGCLDWQANGLGTPAEVELATQEYKDEQVPLEQFFTEFCRFSLLGETTVADLKNAYQNWAGRMGIPTISAQKFNKELQNKGCRCVTKRDSFGNTPKVWEGIALC